MTDLIIGHAQNPPVLPALLSHKVQSCQALTVWAGGTCWGGSNVLPRSLYSPSYLDLILFSHLLPRTKKKLLKLGPAGSAQWGTAPESFYRAKRVQIRCNLPFVAKSPPTQTTVQNILFFNDSHFPVAWSSSFPIFLKVARSQAANQAGSQQMWQALVCRTAVLRKDVLHQ